MAKLNFGNFPVNMGEPEWFGMGSHFSGADAVIVSQGSRQIVLRDPVSGATLTYSGFFDFSTAFTLLNSRITGILARTSSGQLLMDWRGFSVTFEQVVYSPSTGAFNAMVMRGADTVVGGSGSDSLRGYGGDDRMAGGLGNDTLSGESGNDALVGGRGSDSMSGGRGNDTYSVDAGSDRVTEHAAAGIDTVNSGVTYLLSANVEKLTLTGTAPINGTGNGMANTLTGNSAANTLKGLGGNDTYLAGAGDRVVERSGEGVDLVIASVDYILGSHQEHLTLTGAAATGTGNGLDNVLTGTLGDNTLTGHGGADTLNGGGGADQLIGGAGDDVYFVEADDTIVEAADEGIDEVRSRVSYVLGAALEHVRLLGKAGIDATGNDGDNRVSGNSGNNVLDGGAGSDTLTGGNGNDTFIVSSEGDVVSSDSGGIDIVISSVAFDLGASAGVENLTLTGSADINGAGNALSNLITGNSGANVLDGGASGTDTLVGGAGNDTYLVDFDTVIENADEGTDHVMSSFHFALGANLENLTLTGIGHVNGTGNGVDNVIVGNSGFNILNGGAGDDSLDGGAGNDRLDGGTGIDTLAGGAGDDLFVFNGDDILVENADEGMDTVESSVTHVLAAHFENLTLTGSANIDGTGNELDNRLAGNSGNNVLAGGAGNDTYVVNSAGDAVVENAEGGIDLVQSSFDFTLGPNLENLTLTGFTWDGTGNALDNVITGMLGNANVLAGGAGDDTYVITGIFGIGGSVLEDPDGGTDRVLSPGSFTLGDNVEHLTLTGAGAANATGNALGNILIGNSASNVLDGAAGDDSMTGGSGNDTFVVDGAGDAVFENPGEGTDLVRSAITYTLGDNLENVELTGSAAIDATGNALDNVLTGNAGANVLTGGDGNDTYVVDAADSAVENEGEGTDLVLSAATWTLGAHLEKLTLTGEGNVDGSGNGLDNVLTGNLGDNVLTGGGGNDTLDGGNGGTNVLRGGAGDDTYIVDEGWNLPSTVLHLDGEPGDYESGGETYTFTPDTGAFTFSASDQTGDGLVDTVNLSYMEPDLGNWFHVNLSTRMLDRNLEPGFYGEATRYPFEDVGHPGLSVSGNGRGSNTLTGEFTVFAADFDYSGDTPQVERLAVTLEQHSEGGEPALHGTLFMNYPAPPRVDVVEEGAGEGVDTVLSSIDYALPEHVENLTLTGDEAISGTGNVLANTLVGNVAANELAGGAGADVLDGGRGNDTLTGGKGADRFRFTGALGAAGNTDTILDFAADDSIVLDKSVFVHIGDVLGSEEFRIGTAAADANDRIIYNSATGALFFDADGAGGASQVRFARLDTGLALTSADFLMV